MLYVTKVFRICKGLGTRPHRTNGLGEVRMSPNATVSQGPQLVTGGSRSLLTVCSAPGCATLTMGGTCVDHDEPSAVVYPRGRPYPPVQLVSPIASV